MHNSWILIGNLLSGKYKLLLLRDVKELLVTSYTTEIAEVLIKKKSHYILNTDFKYRTPGICDNSDG